MIVLAVVVVGVASAVEEYECVVVLRVVDGGIRMGIGSTLSGEVIGQ